MFFDKGLLAAVADEFSGSPSYLLDRELVLRGPGWSSRAFEVFETLAPLAGRLD